jgi:guanylate kinase
MHQGKALIFCAPSGAGKTTIVKHLVNVMPKLKFSVSATTRAPRNGLEKHGEDYYFLTKEVFAKAIEDGQFYEWQEVYTGIFYGTLKSEVERIWANGNHVIFDLDVIGGLNLKKVLESRALAVFVNAESIEVLANRLKGRETESPESMQLRLEKAEKEMSFAGQFDCQLINRELEVALVQAEGLVSEFIK